MHKCRATQELRCNYLAFVGNGDGLFGMSSTDSLEREKPLTEMSKLLQCVGTVAALNK